MGRRQYANWLVERSKRTDTYNEVRDGQLVEPNSTPATFKSEVAGLYRETPRNVNSLLRVIEAEKLAKRIPKPISKKQLTALVERYEMRQSWCMSTTAVADRRDSCMSDTTFWEPTMGAIECVIDCLPRKAQERIVERLQLLARVQESQGELVASRFSRALSGEPLPTPRPKPNLRLVK